MFGFSSELEDEKQLSGLGVLPGLVVGAAILLGLFCITALVYGFHARRRCGGNLSTLIVTSTVFSHRWHISEEERVSFSPSRQGDSVEEVGGKTSKNQDGSHLMGAKTRYCKNCQCCPLSVEEWMMSIIICIVWTMVFFQKIIKHCQRHNRPRVLYGPKQNIARIANLSTVTDSLSVIFQVYDRVTTEEQ